MLSKDPGLALGLRTTGRGVAALRPVGRGTALMPVGGGAPPRGIVHDPEHGLGELVTEEMEEMVGRGLSGALTTAAG